MILEEFKEKIMNIIKHLKISQKILVFNMLVAVFILIVGFVGFYFTNKAANDMEMIYNDRLLPLEWIGTSLTIQEQNLTNLLMIIQHPEDKEIYLADMNNIKTANDKIFKQYKSIKLLDYEKQKLKELDSIVDAFRKQRKKLLKAVDIGNRASISEEFDKFKKMHDRRMVILNQIKDFNVNEADRINIQNEKNKILSLNLMLVTIFSALAFAVTFGLWVAGLISSPINKVVGNLNHVAEGNLTVEEIQNDANDETGDLSNSLNKTVKNLRTLLSSVSRSIEEISASSQEMSASADQTAVGSEQTSKSAEQLALGTEEIAKSITQGAETLSGINVSIQNISQDAVEVAELSNNSEMTANEGNEQVQKAIQKMSNIKEVAEDISVTIAKLGDLSSEIETIVDLIKNIAGQTDLLALNAAIEAARAGENGKGFAVVADEVKKLAMQSAQATDKITTMIKQIQTETGDAVQKMGNVSNEVEQGVIVIGDTGTSLTNIISQLKNANTKISGITEKIEVVARNSDEVVRMIENISSVTEETAASAEEISAITKEQTLNVQEISQSSQSLAIVAENLNKQASVFKV